MPLLMVVMVALAALSGWQSLQSTSRASAHSAYSLEMAAAVKDVSRYLAAYKGWITANGTGNPWPSASQLFPAYGFTPVTYHTGRSTIYGPNGSGNMVVCYVSQGVDVTRMKALLGPSASVGAASGCPAPAANSAGPSGKAVFYNLPIL